MGFPGGGAEKLGKLPPIRPSSSLSCLHIQSACLLPSLLLVFFLNLICLLPQHMEIPFLWLLAHKVRCWTGSEVLSAYRDAIQPPWAPWRYLISFEKHFCQWSTDHHHIQWQWVPRINGAFDQSHTALSSAAEQTYKSWYKKGKALWFKTRATKTQPRA